MKSRLFWENFKYLRKQHHLTQEQMGAKLGMKRSTYAHCESCGLTIPNSVALVNIIKEFGYTIDFLMTNDLNPDNQHPHKSKRPPVTVTVPKSDNLTISIDCVLMKLRNIKHRIIL